MSTAFIPPIAAMPDVSGLAALEATRAGASPTVASPAAFGQLVTQGIDQVNAQLKASDGDLRTLATGDTGNLHHVMIKLEETRLAFQLMLQVRNRLLESYQEVMRMQV